MQKGPRSTVTSDLELHLNFGFGDVLQFGGEAFLHPGLNSGQALRAEAVNTGRRLPRSVARSGVEDREHGAILGVIG